MKSHEFIKLKESKKSGVADGELTPMQKLKKQVVQWPAKVPRGYELTAHGRLVKKSKTEKPNDGVGGQGMAEGDDLGNLDAVVFSRIDSEKKRLADLKKNNPEAYAREMAKEKSRSRIPPVSTFEEDSNSRYNIIRTNGHGKKDVFAGNYSLEQAKDELAKCLAHLLHTKYGHKFEIVKRDQQGVAEGKKAQDLSIYCKNLVAEMGWKSAYKHALMMANMGRDPSWNGVLRCLDAMKKGVKEASTVDGQRQDPKSSVWKQTSMSREAAVAEYGSQRVRSGGKNRMGQEIIQVLVPLG